MLVHVLVSRAGNRQADDGTGEKGVQKDPREGEGEGQGKGEGKGEGGPGEDGEEAVRGGLQGNFP